MSISLLESTQNLLTDVLATGISLREIAKDSEGFNYEWLKKYAAGKIEHPSVIRVESLHGRLSVLKRRVGRRRAN